MARRSTSATTSERQTPYACPVDGLALREHPPSAPIPAEYRHSRRRIRRSSIRSLWIWQAVGESHRRAILRARLERGIAA